MIPQVKNAAITVLVILVGLPLFTVFQLNSVGEVHGFSGAWEIIQHTFFNTCMFALGWIFFKSPFAGKFTEILTQTSTKLPSGVTKEQMTSITVQEPETGKKP